MIEWLQSVLTHWVLNGAGAVASIASGIFAALAWWGTSSIRKELRRRVRLPSILQKLRSSLRNLETAGRKGDVDRVKRIAAEALAHVTALETFLNTRQNRQTFSWIGDLRTRLGGLRQRGTQVTLSTQVKEAADDLAKLVAAIEHELEDLWLEDTDG